MNDRKSKFLLSCEIVGLLYYMSAFSEVMEFTKSQKMIVVAIAMMISALLFGLFFNLCMTIIMKVYFSIIHFYHKQKYPLQTALQIQMIKSKLHTDDLNELMKIVEKSEIDWIDTNNYFYRELHRGMMLVACSYLIDTLTALNGLSDYILLAGMILMAVISASLYITYEIRVKCECVDSYCIRNQIEQEVKENEV